MSSGSPSYISTLSFADLSTANFYSNSLCAASMSPLDMTTPNTALQSRLDTCKSDTQIVNSPIGFAASCTDTTMTLSVYARDLSSNYLSLSSNTCVTFSSITNLMSFTGCTSGNVTYDLRAEGKALNG